MTKFSRISFLIVMIVIVILLSEQTSARHIELLDRRKRDSSIFPMFYWREKQRKLEESLKNRQFDQNFSSIYDDSKHPLTKEYVQKVYIDVYENAYRTFIEDLQNKSRRQQFRESLENS